MEKGKSILVHIFWIVFFLSMWTILAVAVSKPMNNLIPGRMVIYTLVWVVLYVGVWFFLCFANRRYFGFDKLVKRVMPVWIILFGVALFVVSCILRSEPLTDYEDVYRAAYALATGQEVGNWEYFARWNNNVGSMVVLAALFRLGSPLCGFMDLYYFVLFVNVLQVMGVAYCVYWLAGKVVQRHSAVASAMALIVCTLWLPLWSNTSVFYSDQLSMGAGVFAITLLCKSHEKKHMLIRVGCYVLAGILLGLGLILKVTTGTIIIALTISILLHYKLKNILTHWKEIGITAAAFLVILLCFSLYSRTLPYQKDVYRLKAPVEYWIAIGLGENGTYSASEDFAIRCLTAENVEQRREIAREQIVLQAHNFLSLQHLAGKVQHNFGCGEMGASGYLIFPKQESILWHWFSVEGKYYWKYSCLSTAFFFAVLFLLGMGGLMQAMGKSASTRESIAFLITAMAFWGLCLFLMLWEAQDKQLYNHSAWMMLSLIFSLNLLEEKLFSKQKENVYV